MVVRSQGIVGSRDQIQDLTKENHSYIDPISLIPGLLSDALESGHTVKRLVQLRDKEWFNYPAAQLTLIEQLANAESKAFAQFLKDGSFGPEMRGLVRHKGQIFHKMRQAEADEQPLQAEADEQPLQTEAGEKVSHNWYRSARARGACGAWAKLMLLELQYLNLKDEWNQEHRELAIHACKIMTLMFEIWPKSTDNEALCVIAPGLEKAIFDLTESRAFKNLVNERTPCEDIRVVYEALNLASYLAAPALDEQIADYLEKAYQVCQELMPQEFDMAKEFSEGAHEAAEPKEEVEQGNISDEGDKEYDFLNSGDDFDENAHDEKQRKIDRWMDVIDLSLSAVSDVQSGERFSGQLSQILEASMFDKLLWQTTAQTLIDVDPNEMRKVIPTLLARVAKDDVWIVGVVKIAEYARCAETREGREVFNLVLKSLRGLGRSNAKKLLLTCQYLADEYCQDFRITRDFYRARTLLSKALKSKKKQ